MGRWLQILFAAAILNAFSGVYAQSRPVAWLPFGPDGGDARRFAGDAHDHTHLFLGTANGWIYESRNSGANWKRLARVGKRDDLVLHSILIDPRDPRHLIVGAWAIGGHDGGIFISHDSGVTWTTQAEMRGQSVLSLAAAPSDSKVLVAGTLQGVFRSTDEGQRWKLISPLDSVEIHNVESIAIDPRDPNILYAGTWHLPWKTTDGGEHWENIKDGIIDDSDVFSIIVDPDRPQTVYASACSGIYKSLNGGNRFDKVQGIPTSARRTRVLLQDPNHLETVFAGTTEGLFRSDDAGRTWTRTTGPEIIVNDVSIDPKDSRHVLIATDRGGVLASDDGGDTFKSSNGGFSARQVIAMVADAHHPATVFIGVVNDKEWGGVFQSDNGGINWTQRSEGLQGRDVFSLAQTPDGTIVAGTAHGIYRFDPTALHWVRVVEAPAKIPGAEPARPTIVAARPPVAIGRNQFAKRTTVRVPARIQGQPQTSAQRRAALLKARHAPAAKSRVKGKPLTARAKTAATRKKTSARTTLVHRRPGPARIIPSGPALRTEIVVAPSTKPASLGFDGSVNAIVSAGRTMLAATSLGLLNSTDQGQSWILAGVEQSADWRSLASARNNVVAASLHTLHFSADSGASWTPIPLPPELTLVSAIAVEPSGQLWVGGREGLFVSADAGRTWTTPKNLFVNSVANIFYEEATDRIVITTSGSDSIVFTVQMPQRQIAYAYSGWSLRFARPVGDHLIGATLFDGIVIQPRMVDTPMASPPTK